MTRPGDDDSRVLAALGLPQPLGRRSHVREDSDLNARLWPAVERALGHGKPAPARARRRVLGIRLAAAFALAMVVLAVVVGGADLRNRTVEAGHLLTQNGHRFEKLNVPLSSRQQTLEFRDGSTLVAEPGTLLLSLAASERDVVLRLERGRARFTIQPNRRLRWLVEVGPASVEVVGTVFTLSRTPDRIDVQVARGVVLVRSELLDERVRRMESGSNISLRLTPAIEAPRAASQPSERRDPAMDRSNAAAGSVRSAKVPAHGDAARPLASAAERPPSPEALLERADEARLGGDPERARHWLARFVELYPNDARAGVSAFTLAGLDARAGAPPARVVLGFRRALALATSGSLREDCYLRLVEFEVLAGMSNDARATLANYRREFPEGRHLAKAAALLRKSGPGSGVSP